MSGRFVRESVRHELMRRRLTVLRTSRPATDFVRVTFGGADLAGFASPGPADHVKMFFADAAGETVMRDYTPLNFRADGADGPELEIDFFLHGAAAHGDRAHGDPASGTGASGPAASWAASAEPGDEIEIGGPRGSSLPPSGVDELILVADETALPAVSRWLDVFPETPVTGLFLVGDTGRADYLDGYRAAHRDFRWFAAKPDSAGEPGGEAILHELRGATIGEGTFLFLAGEAKSLVPLRRHLRRELELPKEQVDVHGYWKRGTIGHDHHAPVDPSDPDD